MGDQESDIVHCKLSGVAHLFPGAPLGCGWCMGRSPRWKGREVVFPVRQLRRDAPSGPQSQRWFIHDKPQKMLALQVIMVEQASTGNPGCSNQHWRKGSEDGAWCVCGLCLKVGIGHSYQKTAPVCVCVCVCVCTCAFCTMVAAPQLTEIRGIVLSGDENPFFK